MRETKCRIPCKYFTTTGKGQNSAGSSSDHWETGAYDIALLDAGIENWNVLKYTSVIPPQAQEITMKEALESYYDHGAALETIMAQANGQKGDFLCAGVGIMHVTLNGELIGGFAAEFEGPCSEEEARKALKESLQGIFDRRYKGKEGYEISDMRFITDNMIVDEEFGTVLAAICFVSYLIPDIN
jgi:arginine decarboxylase